MAQLEQSGGVAGALVIALECFLFGGVQRSAGDFLHLKPEQVELLCVSGLVHHKVGLCLLNRGTALEQFCEGGAWRLKATEGIENGQLAGGMQQ